MKKKSKRFLFLVFFILLTLLFAEGLLRLSYRIVNAPGLTGYIRYSHALHSAIYRLWNSGPKNDPFLPPYQVFSNQGSSNSQRLQEIASRAKLPPAGTFSSFDFLQFDQSPGQTRYVIHTNSLGFRGPERPVKKPKGVFRIIVLGSYSTFGLGVNDNDTFPSQLEALLNRRRKGTRRYEVWNGGRPAGTAIVGLARLQNEIFAYEPDLIVLNYGFIDGLILSDNFLVSALQFPDGPGASFIRKLLIPLMSVFEQSYLAGRIEAAISTSKFRHLMRLYNEVMQKSDALCRERRVPLLILNPLGVPPIPRSYVQSRQLSFWQTFVSHPPTFAQYEEAMEKSWVHRLPDVVTFHNFFPHFPYRLNGFQLNKYGYRAIAEALASEAEKLEKLEKHETR